MHWIYLGISVNKCAISSGAGSYHSYIFSDKLGLIIMIKFNNTYSY